MYALVLFGLVEDDDAILLADWTWITFARLQLWPLPRVVDVWLFADTRAAATVRAGFAPSMAIGIVRVEDRWRGCVV